MWLKLNHRQLKIDEFIPDIRIKDSLVDRLIDFNFWGLQIDQRFDWKAHIQKKFE